MQCKILKQDKVIQILTFISALRCSHTSTSLTVKTQLENSDPTVFIAIAHTVSAVSEQQMTEGSIAQIFTSLAVQYLMSDILTQLTQMHANMLININLICVVT